MTGNAIMEYATDRKLLSSEIQFSVKLSSERPLSFADLGQVLDDIDIIFGICAKELSARIKSAASNQKKRNAILVANEFKSGSLEILANPYFQGTVGSLLASGIVSLFVHVCQRINGRPQEQSNDMISRIDKDVITEERAKEAASKAVQKTATARKRLSEKSRSFGLEIRVTFNKKEHDVL